MSLGKYISNVILGIGIMLGSFVAVALSPLLIVTAPLATLGNWWTNNSKNLKKAFGGKGGAA